MHKRGFWRIWNERNSKQIIFIEIVESIRWDGVYVSSCTPLKAFKFQHKNFSSILSFGEGENEAENLIILLLSIRWEKCSFFFLLLRISVFILVMCSAAELLITLFFLNLSFSSQKNKINLFVGKSAFASWT